MRVSALVPYRETEPWRGQLAQWVIKRLLKQLPDVEVCFGDCPGEFQRAKAINAAAAKATGNMYLIHDADTFTNREFLSNTLLFARAGWAFPYGHYYNLNERSTEQLVTGVPEVEIERPTGSEVEFDLTTSVSGLLAVDRDLFEEVGGFDENFIGWGFEDNAFAIAAQTFGGPPVRLKEGFVCHLWHPAPEDVRFGQPNIKYNQTRFTRYQKTRGSKEAVRKVQES